MSPRSWVRFTPRSGTVSGRCLTPLRRTGVKRTKGFGGGSFGAAPSPIYEPVTRVTTRPLHALDLVLVDELGTVIDRYENPNTPRQ